VLGYRVYRWSAASGPEPSLVGTVLHDTTVFFDYTVLNGRPYTYAVAAILDNKAESPRSAAVTVTPLPVDLHISLTINERTAEVNGQAVTLDSPARTVNDRTMVPLRFIGTSLGADVRYDAGPRRVTVTLGSRVVRLWIDETEAEVDGNDLPIDAPPVISQGRTLVPVRFLAQAFGATVGYDHRSRRVTVTMVDKDSSFNSATTVVPGQPVTAAISGANDVDVYRLHVLPGETYRVRVEALTGGLDLVVTLLDPTTGEAGSVDDWPLGQPDPEIATRLAVAGAQLFARVQVSEPAGLEGGNYRLILENRTEPGDSPAGATLLPVSDGTASGGPGGVEGALAWPSDVDHYRFEAAAGQAYRFSVAPLPGTGPHGETVFGDLAVDLLAGAVAGAVPGAGEDWVVIAGDDDPRGLDAGGATLVWECVTGGDYVLAVRSRTGRPGPYALRVSPAEPDAPGGITGARQVLPDHTAWSEWLSHPEDQDWFVFMAARGTTYYVHAGDPAAGCDTVLTLVDRQGSVLAVNDDAPGFGWPLGGSMVSWTASYDGPVYAWVAPYAGHSLGRYWFSVTTAAPENDDHPRFASALSPGDRVTRSLTEADSDWFTFEARAGVTYIIETGDLQRGCDTCLELYDQAGRVLASSDDVSAESGNFASRIEWTARTSGTVYVRAYPFQDSAATATGIYTLTLSVTP